MDITIQMRSLELLIKMLKRDMEGIPAYGYTRQMGSLPLLSARESLPRCTPEEAGLSSTVVERFFRNLSDNTAECCCATARSSPRDITPRIGLRSPICCTLPARASPLPP